jgi:signal transduction histidine kinase/CheY-like chemotaxis protein/ligand-binding sensor domain-containing protein
MQAQKDLLHLQKYGLEEGLSSQNIHSIYHDSRGFTWISTDYGLNRYDGNEFKVYTKEENGLCNNVVLHVSEDKKGNLWVLGGGLGHDYCHSIFNPIQEKFYTLEGYLGLVPPFDPSRTFFQSANNEQWLFKEKYAEKELYAYYEYNGTAFDRLFQDFSDSSIKVTAYIPILRLNDGNYAFPNIENGQVPILNKKGTYISEYNCPDATPFLSTIENEQSVCNFNCTDIPLYTEVTSKQKKVTWFLYDENVQTATISIDKEARYLQHKNLIYVLSSDSLWIYDEQGIIKHQAASPLELTSYPGAFSIDNHGNIWLANDEYLYLLSVIKQPFEIELASSSPSLFSRWRGIIQTQEGRLCVAGYLRFQHRANGSKNWTSGLSNHEGDFSQNPYLGLAALGSDLWLGTEYRYLHRYNWKTKAHKAYTIKNNKGAIVHLILQPYLAKDSSLWVGTVEGVFYWNQAQDTFVPSSLNKHPILRQSAVYYFYQNKTGTWLCTSKGLFLVDLNTQTVLKHFSSENIEGASFPNAAILHLHEDKQGDFWLATKGSGLIRWNYKTQSYLQYTQNGAGLSHNVLYAIYGDAFGQLWISSQRGLMQFDIETETVKIYSKENGLPHNEFNTGSHYQAADGRLYFGGQNGIIHFQPKDFEERSKNTPFVITSYTKESTTTETSQNYTEALLKKPYIELGIEDKSFSLEFALLDFLNSSQHLYSYKIEGYDNNWIYQTSNSIKINTLPYGRYQLKLRAKAANNATWIPYPEVITISVQRPFYLQTWFLIACFLLLIITIYASFKWRINLLERRKRELEAIVQERTAQIEKDKTLIEQQAEALKALDEVKSKFFANISHELRTPLTLILGPLSYILDQPDEWEKEGIQKQLLTMQRNGKSLMQLIEEILDLSKLEANKLELTEEPTPVTDFFEAIFAVFEPQFEYLELNATLNLQLKTPQLTLLLDRKKMERVLNNFLSNALKFTPKKGDITLQVVEMDHKLRIKVSDTGKGVHPDDLPHLFERFYQSKRAEQKLYGGTGIGLALVHEFALLMSAKTYVESTLGTGSHFYFELPKKVCEYVVPIISQIAPQEGELIHNIGTNFTILVVEDNRDMQEFIAQLLQQKYKVLTAKNGLEGWNLLKEGKTAINLVVSDVMMPEMDGFTLLKHIKSNSNIPVIMLTALAAERDKLTALTIGVDDYLTKPFSATELLIRVQNLLYNYAQRVEAQQEEPFYAQDAVQDKTYSILDKEWIDNLEITVVESLKDKIINVEQMAASVFLSTRQLNRKIKAMTGLTPAKFIKEVQLQAAKIELDTGKVLSLKEVAFNNGFEFPTTFSTLFKKRFGLSPSSYLKNSKGD